MNRNSVTLWAGLAAAACCMAAWPAYAQTRMYNTAKVKIQSGKQIFGGTIQSPDANMYCAMANAGFDFLWIEMQHSPLTYGDVAKMIWACRGSAAVPFLRVPDALEGDIQKATDIGVLGVIVPTVDTVEKAQNAVKWAKYPTQGRRSMGAGQSRTLWGEDYRQTINDNMFVTVMIETPIGVENAEKIASVPGLDVVFAASGDLGNFSGHYMDPKTHKGDSLYESMVTRIHDVTLAHGVKLGGPDAWKDRPGFSFFQSTSEVPVIGAGARSLGFTPAGGRGGAQ